MGELTLVLGGARSGKSTYAEKLALQAGSKVVYIATAEARDEEMAERIQKHQAQRPSSWQTLEIPHDVGDYLLQHPLAAGVEVVLLDCLTLLATNVMLAASPDPEVVDEAGVETAVNAEIQSLLSTIQDSAARWIVVSNEVGLGLVPPYPLGRLFRDVVGRANQQLAQAADTVVFMIAGLPMPLK
ncbi:MAG: bifunctional adenosylcobinamide kinase/adenosylcobinamide-phosphate guanylyltransferase [Anaerolineales bacterium]|nr:bifunctional adenosylcobinamide kinase/adenosylcobinamide-phosphate guanylyltransferase [Anaerolineales bacterium]